MLFRSVFKDEIKTDIFGKKTQRQVVGFMDDEKGGWWVLEYPNKENLFKDNGGYLEPLNTGMYQIGTDTTQQERLAINGSDPAITIFKKSCIIDGIEMGMYPVAFWIPPLRLAMHFDEEVRKSCLWYGCKVNYEIDRRTDYISHFAKHKCSAFLTWTPIILRNPAKRGACAAAAARQRQHPNLKK